MKILIVIFLVTIVVAEEFSVVKFNSTDELGNSRSTEVSARKKHKIFHGHRHHLWLAGLHALGIFTAIKFKLFFIALAIGLTIFFGIKVWAGKALLGGGIGGYPPPPPPIPYVHDPTPYIPYEHGGFEHGPVEFDHPPIDSSGAYSQYPGPPSNSYSPGQYSPSGAGGAQSPDTQSFSPYGPYGGTSAPSTANDVTSEHSYARVSKQKRDITDETWRWTDIAFTFLGVDSKDCRKRFVCEMELKTRKHRITRMAFDFLSVNFLDLYRHHSEKPKSIDDCERMYNGCVTNMPAKKVKKIKKGELNDVKVEDNEVRKESRSVGDVTTPPKVVEEAGRIILKSWSNITKGD